jgi:hypothetical protein
MRDECLALCEDDGRLAIGPDAARIKTRRDPASDFDHMLESFDLPYESFDQSIDSFAWRTARPTIARIRRDRMCGSFIRRIMALIEPVPSLMG